MRPSLLILSLAAHATAVAAAMGFGAWASAREVRPRPQVAVLATAAGAPPAEPAVEAPPPVEAEAPVAEPLPDEPWLARAIEPPAEPPRDDRASDARAEAVRPTLQPLVRARTEPAPPVPAAAAAEPSATVEAARHADNEPPVYPEHDLRLRHEGVVVVRVAVDERGRVAGVELREPCRHPGLNREALRAVRRWRFDPARRDGVPIASETDVTIEFVLAER